MNRFLAGTAIAAVAILVAVSNVTVAVASEVLPRAFIGAWASEIAECAQTGESSPMRVDGRFIVGYEYGWTIRTWSRRGDVWIGRGTADDDQGSTPATVRMRLRADGTLDFINSAGAPFTEGPGRIRCPAITGTSR